MACSVEISQSLSQVFVVIASELRNKMAVGQEQERHMGSQHLLPFIKTVVASIIAKSPNFLQQRTTMTPNMKPFLM